MTEIEKLEAGLEYCYDDHDVEARKENAIIKCKEYNAIDDTDYDSQYAKLKEMLGSVGEKVWIAKTFNCDNGKKIHIGNNFTGNYNLTILDIREVYIGDNVMIGPNTLITTVNHPLTPMGRRRHIGIAKPVTIGDDVWIGGNVTILPGVTIGNNVVVAAGAVVTKDLEDNGLYGGVPARKIKDIENDVEKNSKMKTIRLLYPDYVSGGLETYYFGANLLQHMLPQNDNQSVVRVDVIPPDGKEKAVTNGISAEDEVLHGIKDAQEKLSAEKPDRVITIGGNCMVSLAPFDYLHGLYPDAGIIWIDAHPDVSTVNDGYPNAHAMVLGSLMGHGAEQLSSQMKNAKFKADEILYVGLQPLHDYQEKFLNEVGVNYKVQDTEFVSDDEIRAFSGRFEHILVHFDIDVLDEHFFHSTYFANPELVGDGAGGGMMTMEKLGQVLKLIEDSSDVVGFTIAEYLPFDEERLHKMLSEIRIFKD